MDRRSRRAVWHSERGAQADDAHMVARVHWQRMHVVSHKLQNDKKIHLKTELWPLMCSANGMGCRVFEYERHRYIALYRSERAKHHAKGKPCAEHKATFRFLLVFSWRAKTFRTKSVRSHCTKHCVDCVRSVTCDTDIITS